MHRLCEDVWLGQNERELELIPVERVPDQMVLHLRCEYEDIFMHARQLVDRPPSQYG